MILVLAVDAEGSLIRECGAELREDIAVCKEVGSLLSEVCLRPPAAVLVDVTAFDLDGVEAVERMKKDPATRSIPIVAFGDSLRADLLQDAQEAGADLVLPRAAFHKQLEGILRRFKANGKA